MLKLKLKHCAVFLVDDENADTCKEIHAEIMDGVEEPVRWFMHDGCLGQGFGASSFLWGSPRQRSNLFAEEIALGVKSVPSVFFISSQELFLALRALVKRGEVKTNEIQVLWPRPNGELIEIHINPDGRYDEPADFTFGVHFDALLSELLGADDAPPAA